MMEWAVTSSMLVAVVIALRFLSRRKISRRLQYALWGLVLLRLLMPFSLFGSAFSVMNAVPDSHIGEKQVYVLPVSSQPAEEASGVFTDHDGITDANSFGYAVLSEDGGHITRYADKMSISRILTLVWVVGAIAVCLYFAGANLLFFKRLRNSRKLHPVSDCKLPVYVTGHVASPCLFGLIRPAIYLTPKATASADSTRHVLAHELCHYRHGDHIWSMLRCLCLAVWWWNPLVWAAAILSRTDGELACDEAAVKKIGQENRLSYGHTLVDMIAVRKAPGLMYAATTMVSGKRGIKERLNMIIKSPKTFIPVAVAVLLIVAVCVGCTFTGADKDTQEPDFPRVEKGAPEPDFPEVDTVFSSDSADLTEIGCEAAAFYYEQFMEDDIPQYWHITKHEVLSCDLLVRQIQGEAQEFTVWVTSYLETDGFGFLVGQGAPTDPDDMSKGGVCPEVGRQFRIKTLPDGRYEIVGIGTGGYNQGQIGAEVSLEGGEQRILPKRYDKNKFDFDYDSLPVLQITEGAGTFIIMLGSDTDTVRVGEDYYTYSGNAGFVDKETYALDREADGTFRLPVEMRGDTRDESAIYYVETDQDLYVFKADFLLEKSAEGGEGNQSQWFTGETYPGNHARALFSLSDGTRAELLLSQPVRQDGTGIWCVERWSDEDGNETLVTPDTDSPAMEYYQQLQQSCDNGHRPGLLDPKQVALEYISGVLGQSDISGRVHITYDIDRILNTCVSDAILNVNADLYTDGDFATEAHTVLKIEEYDNKVYERDEDTGTIRYWIEQDGSETTVYAMVLYLKFSFTEDGFSETGGSHMPVAITFVKNDAGEYVLKEYWEPWDGDAYASSIAGKFPSDIYEDALDTQKYIVAHMQSCYAQAIAYGDVDADAVISGLVDTIASSPSQVSDPQAYIDAHEMEYRELIYLGEYTLRYCFTLFEQGGRTGLKGHIMAAACREILGDVGDVNVPVGTGQEWYDALPQSVKDRYR